MAPVPAQLARQFVMTSGMKRYQAVLNRDDAEDPEGGGEPEAPDDARDVESVRFAAPFPALVTNLWDAGCKVRK